MKLNELCQRVWYQDHSPGWLLLPLSWLYQGFMAVRDLLYRCGVLPVYYVGVPVIVVGNLTIGGTGKTPLVLWLAEYLKQNGYRPGIVSRGYGGQGGGQPQPVRSDSDPAEVGDEPLLLLRRSSCPVVIGHRRHLAARSLIDRYGCNVIISDDGLQHLALGRDIEIVVIDGQRRFGNGFCLPAGPLREGRGRLRRVSAVVSSGRAEQGEHAMTIHADYLCSLNGSTPDIQLQDWRGRTVHAVAGTGNPERFFSLLRRHDLKVIGHAFPDHHHYRIEEMQFEGEHPLVMTEKDAVKCERLKLRNAWYVPISISLPSTFEYQLNHLLQELADG